MSDLVPLMEARATLGPLATAIHHGSRPAATITSHGRPLARLVPLDTGVMPPPCLWDEARDALDGELDALSGPAARIAVALDNLVRVYDGQDPA